MSEPGRTSSEATADPAAAHQGRMIARHVACTTCGYDLKGLPEQGRCPECGRAVLASITRALPPGWSAQAARRISRGLFGFSVALPLGIPVLVASVLPPLFLPLFAAWLAVAVWGVWLLTVRPGAGVAGLGLLRLAVRAATAAVALAALAAAAMFCIAAWRDSLDPLGGGMLFVAVTGVGGPVAALLLLLHLGALARPMLVPIGPRLARVALLILAMAASVAMSLASGGMLAVFAAPYVFAGTIWSVWSVICALDWLRGEVAARLRVAAAMTPG